MTVAELYGANNTPYDEDPEEIEADLFAIKRLGELNVI